MNWDIDEYIPWDLITKIVLLILIAIGLSIVVAMFFPPATAYVQIAQGDDVWLNETVDISLAITWPDYTIAWCKSQNIGCIPPDQVLKIKGYQRSYYIDPDVFHPGWYYRWDGKWNSGENQYAFRVRTGERPVKNITTNVTPEPTQKIIGMDIKGNGPFEYIVARGDEPDIVFKYVPYSGTCGTDNSKATAKLWLFGKTEMQMDIPIKTLSDNRYEILMNESQTMDLSAGVYDGYIQFPGMNGRQDVFYDKVAHCFDTPYDDAMVLDEPVMDWNIAATRLIFERMIFDPKFSDDMLIPIKFTVKEPEIIVTDITQGQDRMWITGITTWWNGTPLTIELDPDNYALAQDKRLHTWVTKAEGDTGAYRRFTQQIPIEMKEMYIGVHEIKVSVNKNNRETAMYHNFRITGTFVMPTPTPEFEKYITDINGDRIMDAVPIPTQTPTPTPTQTIQHTPTPTSNITTNSTKTPTIATTVPTIQHTPTPTRDQNITVPGFPWYVALLAIGFAIWRKK